MLLNSILSNIGSQLRRLYNYIVGMFRPIFIYREYNRQMKYLDKVLVEDDKLYKKD